MTPGQNKRIHGLLADLRWTEAKEDLVLQFTEERTSRSSEMDVDEAATLITFLELEKERRCKRMRGKIIHLLCVYGMTKEDGTADYDRINAYVREIGSRNPEKKNLFYLTATQTHDVLNQIESMVKKELSK